MCACAKNYYIFSYIIYINYNVGYQKICIDDYNFTKNICHKYLVIFLKWQKINKTRY